MFLEAEPCATNFSCLPTTQGLEGTTMHTCEELGAFLESIPYRDLHLLPAGLQLWLGTHYPTVGTAHSPLHRHLSDIRKDLLRGFSGFGKNCKGFLQSQGRGGSSGFPHRISSEVLAGPASLLPAQEMLLVFLKEKLKPYVYTKGPVTIYLSVCMPSVPKREETAC